MEQHWSLEYKRWRYKNRIREERINFWFLKDGTMMYPYEKFKSYVDAIIDAIRQGENMEELIALIFREKLDQRIIKQKLINLMNK